MPHRSLRIAAARSALGMAATAELIDAAHDALNDSVYSYSLGELATHRDPNWADCHRLFVAALEELDEPVPAPSAAVMRLLELHAVRITEGAVTPEDGLLELYSIERAQWYGSPTNVPAAALEPLQPFIGLYYTVEEERASRGYRQEHGLPEPEEGRLEQLREEVVTRAKAWCAEQWGPADPAWLTDTVLSLAKQMDDTREFGALPILADALQEAGCENEAILDHCRDRTAAHAHGCWVVDLVLGKE